ncbi:MAG TPA: hypothetical protein VFE30_00050 [Anaeromyxobacteraceae bacterium]|jgi:hypothetical protein|nr:hypothetical protein [Anaeromyxobacteraceae bacterium]
MKLVASLLTMFAAFAISTSTAYAADPTREETGRVVKLPETAADHAALAKYYDDKAGEWRREAEYHQGMAAEYKKSHGDTKNAAMMEKHCAKLSKDARDMAKEAKTMADYHRLRAGESK